GRCACRRSRCHDGRGNDGQREHTGQDEGAAEEHLDSAAIHLSLVPLTLTDGVRSDGGQAVVCGTPCPDRQHHRRRCRLDQDEYATRVAGSWWHDWRVTAALVSHCPESREASPPATTHLHLMRSAYARDVLRKLPQLVDLADEQRLVGTVSWENLAG